MEVLMMIVITLDDILSLLGIAAGLILVIVAWLLGEFGGKKRGGKR
jgi:hypothetical protein